MAILPKEKDYRRFPRVDSRLPVRYQLGGGQDFDNVLCNDISCGGIKFTSERFIPTSTPVMLEINVLNRLIRPIGKISWSTPLAHSDRNQMGIEFTDFNVLERNYLKDFVNMQLGQI
ncbi:MAG: PilZ domain-containing protein [Candidatus Omnitrophica bacterium]|nr:PilZ domain-containing protein [Candidatus Omnitrophota bacterium]